MAVLAYLPATQGVQTPLAAAAEVPLPHGAAVGVDEPSAQAYPAVQGPLHALERTLPPEPKLPTGHGKQESLDVALPPLQ